MKTKNGFTLIELIVVLAIAGILMSIAVPSFQEMIKDNRLVTQTNTLVTHINLARSEAIKRGVPVILCASNDPSAATPVCSASGSFANGWFMFADGDKLTPAVSSGVFENANDTVLRIGAAAELNVTLNSTVDDLPNDNLAFNNDGTLDTDSNATTVSFAICDDRGVNHGRQVNINFIGRPTLTKASATSPLTTCTP